MKKIILVLSFLFLLILNGCANKSEKFTISFSTWGSASEIAIIEDLINEFENKNPEIHVNLIHIPDNYFQKLHLLIASNLTPDVIFINNLNANIYTDAGKFEDLTPFINESKTLSKNQFFEKSFIPMSKNGKIYAIPRDISNLVVYYNKDIFDKYGVKYPSKNWTQQDFLRIAQKLTIDTDNDGKIDIFGFGFEKKSLFWLPFLLLNDGAILSSDAKNVVLENENSLQGLQFYSDLRNKYHVAPKNDEQSSLTTSQMFMQGKIAMHTCGRWCSLTYKKNKNLHWDVVNFPVNKNNISTVPLDVSGWAISSSSTHKKEAWKFIEFMASEKSMKKMTSGGLITPANKQAANSSAFLTPPPLHAKTFLDIISSSIPTPTCVKYAEINDLLDEKTEPLFNGKMRANEIINEKMLTDMKNLLDKRIENEIR